MLVQDRTMIDDLADLPSALGRAHWRVEAVTVRLHVLRMAIGGDWPGSLDDADAGLADAVDRLRTEELARAVRTTACATRLGLDPETTLNGLLACAVTPELAQQLLTAAEGLGHAIEAAHAAADEVVAELERAAFEARPESSLRPVVSPARAGQLHRLVERVIPPSIERFLGLHVA